MDFLRPSGAMAGLFTARRSLSSPATRMISDFPQTLAKLQDTVAPLKGLVDRAQGLMARFGLEGGASVNPAETLRAGAGSIAGAVASSASSFASHLLETLLILFYLLVFGETFMRRLIATRPTGCRLAL